MLKYIKQLAGETVIYGLSTVLLKFTGIFMIPIYTNYFPPEEFGVIKLVNVTYSVIAVLTALGLDSAAALYYYKYKGRFRMVPISNWFWMQLCLTVFFSLFLFIFSSNTSELIVKDHRGSLPFKIIAFHLITSIVPKVLIATYRFQRKPLKTTIFTVVYTLTTIFLTIYFITILKSGINGVFWSQLISSSLFALIGLYFLKDWIGFKNINLSILKTMLKYSFPLVPAVAAIWVLNSSSSYFINAYLSTEEVGIFSIATSISSVILIFITAFQRALGPFVFSIHKEKEAKEIYAQIFTGFIIVVSIAFIGISLFSEEALFYFTTPAYYEGANLVPYILISYISTGLYYVASIGLNIAETNVPYAKGVIISAFISVVLFYIMIPSFGLLGAALALAISQAFVPVYMFRVAQRIYPIPYRFLQGVGILSISMISVILFKFFSGKLQAFSQISIGSILIKCAYVFFIFFMLILFNRKAIFTLLNQYKKTKL